MDWSIWYADPHDFRTTLLFLSSIVWLVFFVDAVPWRNLKSLRGKYMLMFLISMYFIQSASLFGYAFAHAYLLIKHEFVMHAVVFLIALFNWLVCFVNIAVSRVAISRGYAKRGEIGGMACIVQFGIYLFVFVRQGVL